MKRNLFNPLTKIFLILSLFLFLATYYYYRKAKKIQLQTYEANRETIVEKVAITHQDSDNDTIADEVLTMNIEQDGERQNFDSIGAIIYMNEDLKKRNENLERKLSIVKDKFEKEKSHNEKLNAAIAELNAKLEQPVNIKSTNNQEVETLIAERNELMNQLKTSNKALLSQNEKLIKIVERHRKANIDLYFIYEAENPEKETKIYLTSEGVSELYLKYFERKNPDIYIKCQLNNDLFDAGVEKIELRIHDSKDVVVYSSEHTIAFKDIDIKIKGRDFPTDTYYITLRNGPEDLIIGSRYYFKIDQKPLVVGENS